jgi:hypothetical protein
MADLALLLALESGGFARPANVPNVGGLLWSHCPREKMSSVLFVSRNFESALLPTFVFAQWWDFETLHCPT